MLPIQDAKGRTLENYLVDAFYKVQWVATRFPFIRAYFELGKRYGREKSYDQRAGDAINVLVHDQADMMVVHLGSWCKAVTAAGGLFGIMCATFLRELPKKRRRSETREFPPSAAARDDAHRAAFDRLFPNVPQNKGFPSQADLVGLKESFRNRVAPLVAERDTYQAHRFERDDDDDDDGEPLHSPEQMQSLLDYLEGLLNDLLLVACSTRREFGGYADRKLASHFVELAILGDPSPIPEDATEAERDAVFDWLHARHSRSEERFNHDVFTPEVRAEIVEVVRAHRVRGSAVTP